jgi:hypothetical protein
MVRKLFQGEAEPPATPSIERRPRSLQDNEETRRKEGARLQSVRKRYGLLQKEVGVRLGVSAPVVSNYECGLTRLSANRILAFAEAIGCTCDEIIRGCPPADGRR